MSANATPPEPITAVRVIAHRGDSEAARENTLQAFRAAIQAGATDIELDVRTSRDGVSIVIHDATTLRLWGHPAAVADQDAAALTCLGRHETRIPTLQQVLDLLAETSNPPRLVVDCGTPEDATTAWTTIRRHPASREGRLPVAWCGALSAMEAVRELDEQAEVFFPHEGGTLDLAAVDALGARLVNTDWTLLTPDLVNTAHDHGLDVGCWTLDDAEAISWAIDLGVDAITSNRPRLLRELATKGYSPLAMAWADVDQLAARLGLGEDIARWIAVARELGEWSIGHTRTAALGSVEAKKHPADVVTAVDRSVEEHVRAVLAAEFPEHVVIGEEFGGELVEGAPTWYLDPVDGTTNLANGLPWTAMSLALAIDGTPVVAVVAQPWTGEVYLAARGLGATLNGRPLQLGRVDDLAGKLVCTESSAHELWDGQVEFMQRLSEAWCTTRLMGSGTLTLTRVASGDAVAGLVHAFHPIDHLAGALIALEAGARILTSDGGDHPFPSGGGMLVAAPGAAEKLWPLWQPDSFQY